MRGVAATAPVDAPGEADIRAELQRVLMSADFDVPERARKFLSYVVEEALAGRAERIKAYSIATEVFGRDASFDAQGDPVVRIEAGRIRRALERYFLTSGQDDPIVLTMPKGGYVPIFTRRDQPFAEPETAPAVEQAAPPPSPERRAPWRLPLFLLIPALALAFGAGALLVRAMETEQGAMRATDDRIAQRPGIARLVIEPFEDLSKTSQSEVLAKGMTYEVIGELAKFKDLTIFHGALRPDDSRGRSSRYSLSGSVQESGENLHLTARLVNHEDGSVAWTNTYDNALTVPALVDIQRDIASKVATALGQPYGAIFQADSTSRRR